MKIKMPGKKRPRKDSPLSLRGIKFENALRINAPHASTVKAQEIKMPAPVCHQYWGLVGTRPKAYCFNS